MGRSPNPLGLPVVHHNDRKLILLVSLSLFFTIYNWVTVSFTDFYEITSCFSRLSFTTSEVSITS
jgi:hypothetical protein